MDAKLLTLVVVGVFLCTPMAFVDTDATDTGFDVTDSTGKTIHFDGPAEHIVTAGLGVTLTVADAGAIDKIVAVDKYSTYSSSKQEQLKDLNAVDLGSFYGSHENIITELINLVDGGKLSKDDPLLLTGSTSNTALREKLEDIGFTTVLVWMTSDITEYDDLVSFVKDVSMIAAGVGNDTIQKMTETVDNVKSTVSTISDEDKAKAISVWYSSKNSTVMINDHGITHSMLEVCNATDIGYKESGTGYSGDENEIIRLLGENPGTVIFLSSSWASAGKTVDDFRDEILNGSTEFKIVQMGALWNNYCPESADGLLEMGKALYPEAFGSTSPETPENNSGNNDVTMWVIVLLVAIIICAAAYVVFKRTHK